MKKFYQQIKYVAVIVIAAFIIASCSSSKRAALAKVVAAAKTAQQNDAAMLEVMQQKKAEKIEEEKVDAAIAEKINNRLTGYKTQLDSFSTAVNFIDASIKSGKIYRKSKSQIKIQLKLLQNYTSNANLRLRRFKMIDEGLDIADKKLYKLAAFFGGGKYEIPAEKFELAAQAFAPVLDSVANFYNNYNDVERMATITVLGFADGTGFNKEGETYKKLQALLNDSAATKEMMNMKVSELRAKTIADLLEVVLAKKITGYKEIDFEYLENGRGEAFPSKKVNDYLVDDERRRVVLLFWSILPK